MFSHLPRFTSSGRGTVQKGCEAAMKRSILQEEQYSVQTGSLDFDPGYDPTERKKQLLFYLC